MRKLVLNYRAFQPNKQFLINIYDKNLKLKMPLENADINIW